MKIVLKRAVPGLGEPGDVREVSGGFARNYLLPRGLAIPESEAALHEAKKWQARRQRRERRLRAAAERLKETLEGRTVKFEAEGSGEKIFGAVTPAKIADSLRKEGIRLRPEAIHLPRPIQSPGLHSVEVRLHPEVRATLKVEVAT